MCTPSFTFYIISILYF